MGKNEILLILRDYKKQFADQYGITALGVFGSVARGQDHYNSDVDIVIEISKPDLFILAGIKSDLEEKFHKPVGIVTYRQKMNQFLKNRIDRDAVYV
jgi:predicted nucleotidyltransferase